MTGIEFVPMCKNCKQIIWDIVDYKEGYREPTILGEVDYFKHYEISPARCPHCGEIFDSISVPSRLPYDNRLNHFFNDDSKT